MISRRRKLKNVRGAAFVETALLTAFITLAAIVSSQALGNGIAQKLAEGGSTTTDPEPILPPPPPLRP